jgi:hypothetical protein
MLNNDGESLSVAGNMKQMLPRLEQEPKAGWSKGETCRIEATMAHALEVTEEMQVTQRNGVKLTVRHQTLLNIVFQFQCSLTLLRVAGSRSDEMNDFYEFT